MRFTSFTVLKVWTDVIRNVKQHLLKLSIILFRAKTNF